MVRPKQWKRDTGLGTWNVKSLYKSGSLTAAARELARYKLGLVGVQEVRREKGGTVRVGDYIIFYAKINQNRQLGTGYLYTTEKYQQLRGKRLFVMGCHI
jgi:hypothetical protein